MCLELAIKYAEKNPIRARGRNSISRFASVLTDGYNTFIGWNSYKSHTLQARFAKNPEQICIHSEIAAIAKALRFTKGKPLYKYNLYVARLLADGSTGIAKPCAGCQSAILEFGIKQVEWTK